MTESVATRLVNAVAADQEKEMEEIVVTNGIDINAILQYCSIGCLLLIIAAQQNAIKCTRKLIQLGADVDKRCSGGWTAFMHACENSDDDIAMVLVEAGANCNLGTENASTRVPISVKVVNAIVERERRAHNATQKEVEAPKIFPKEGWLCMFLTNNGVPEEVAKECEKKLVNEGIYSPLILALLPQHTFTLEYLTSIGIKTRGLQYLLIGLFTELYQKKCRKWEPLWTQELEEAAKVNKKRARD